MTKKILFGTTLAAIIVLAGFSSITNAQPIKPNTFFQQIKDRITKNEWEPGPLLGFLAFLLLLLYSFLIGTFP